MGIRPSDELLEKVSFLASIWDEHSSESLNRDAYVSTRDGLCIDGRFEPEEVPLLIAMLLNYFMEQ